MSRGEITVTVDHDICASTGGCVQICPEVFQIGDDGYLVVLQERPAAAFAAAVLSAADNCPTAAITVTT